MIILNRYFADRSSVGRGDSRDESVHFAIERQLPKQFAPIRLEGRSKVMNVDAAELGHQPVGTTGRDLAEQQIVDTVAAPPAYDVVALFDLFQENWNLCRIVLKVAVHCDYIVTRAVRKSSS